MSVSSIRMAARSLALLAGVFISFNLPGQSLRPPAVPLVACDPYFSIWSPADKLTDADTVHWTGKPHRLASLIRIDGKAFRLMGRDPESVPALPQRSVAVLPTRTLYSFEGNGVRVTLTFLTAALPEDIDLLSRPVTYLTWDAQATDGYDVVIEAAGSARAFETAYRMLGPGGRLVTVGLPAPGAMATIAPLDLVAGGRSIIGSYLGSAVPRRDIPVFVEMWRAGRLPVERLVSHHIGLDDLNAGLDRLASGAAIRQVITF